jgi:hypothetical protein
MLDRARLREAKAGLDASVTELSEASDINDGLEDSIDRPDDRNGLRDKASDFESKWNDKRGKLTENLKNIQDQLKQILDGWDEWERQTTASLSETAEPNATTNVNVVR